MKTKTLNKLIKKQHPIGKFIHYNNGVLQYKFSVYTPISGSKSTRCFFWLFLPVSDFKNIVLHNKISILDYKNYVDSDIIYFSEVKDT
jgi:hypothetical protein